MASKGFFEQRNFYLSPNRGGHNHAKMGIQNREISKHKSQGSVLRRKGKLGWRKENQKCAGRTSWSRRSLNFILKRLGGLCRIWAWLCSIFSFFLLIFNFFYLNTDIISRDWIAFSKGYSDHWLWNDCEGGMGAPTPSHSACLAFAFILLKCHRA